MQRLAFKPVTEAWYTGHRILERRTSVRVSSPDTTPIGEQVRGRLAELALDVPQKSRFMTFLKVADDVDADPGLRLLAYQDLRMLLLALKVLTPISEWRVALERALVYDAALPVLTGNSRGRDALFELYAAARLKIIGVEVSCEEPDIVCSRGGFKFAVAAKRIKSKDKLLFRVKEARNQIVKSGLPGFIAIDVSPLHPDYGRVKYASVSALSKYGLDMMDRCFESQLPNIEKKCDRRQVFGIIAFAMYGAYTEGGDTLMCAPFHNGHRLCPAGSYKAQQFWEIVDSLSRSDFSFL